MSVPIQLAAKALNVEDHTKVEWRRWETALWGCTYQQHLDELMKPSKEHAPQFYSLERCNDTLISKRIYHDQILVPRYHTEYTAPGMQRNGWGRGSPKQTRNMITVSEAGTAPRLIRHSKRSRRQPEGHHGVRSGITEFLKTVGVLDSNRGQRGTQGVSWQVLDPGLWLMHTDFRIMFEYTCRHCKLI